MTKAKLIETDEQPNKQPAIMFQQKTSVQMDEMYSLRAAKKAKIGVAKSEDMERRQIKSVRIAEPEVEAACAAATSAEVVEVERLPIGEKQELLAPILFRPPTIPSLITVGKESLDEVAGNEGLMKVIKEEIRSRHAKFVMEAQVTACMIKATHCPNPLMYRAAAIAAEVARADHAYSMSLMDPNVVLKYDQNFGLGIAMGCVNGYFIQLIIGTNLFPRPMRCPTDDFENQPPILD